VTTLEQPAWSAVVANAGFRLAFDPKFGRVRAIQALVAKAAKAFVIEIGVFDRIAAICLPNVNFEAIWLDFVDFFRYSPPFFPFFH
jgi:hypothetical protein